MKHCFIFLGFVTFFTLTAQKAENPWVVSVGTDLINVLEKVDGKNENLVSAPALNVSRYLIKEVSVGIQYTPSLIKLNGNDLTHVALDGIIKYNIVEKKVVPFVFGGYGVSIFKKASSKSEGPFRSKETSRTILGGIGANYFLNDHWAINYSSAYRNAYENDSYNHLQHIIGLSYNFGASDSDKDGINDRKDDCPKISGLKEFKGCPDSDGDGIPDHKDKCPEEPGQEMNFGCPDTDGDGVIDNNDACPDSPGSIEMNGCPDSDGDSVMDHLDECPKVAGEPNNNGCPWEDSDDDGIPNKEDNCPNIKGVASNNGCPESRKYLSAFFESEKSVILFSISSSKVFNKYNPALIELISLLKVNSDVKITVAGHASSDGNAKFNMELSEKRAKTVKDFLVNRGINASRIKTIGYGENRPIGDNNTLNGRLMNRRVKVTQ